MTFLCTREGRGTGCFCRTAPTKTIASVALPIKPLPLPPGIIKHSADGVLPGQGNLKRVPRAACACPLRERPFFFLVFDRVDVMWGEVALRFS